jgi:glycosyltransferase involved in cell wall biosynthesis
LPALPQIGDDEKLVTRNLIANFSHADANRNILASGFECLLAAGPRRPGSRAVNAPAILQVIPGLDAGGAERTTIDITRALIANGYRALVATEGGRLERDLLLAGGEIIRANMATKKPHRIIANAAVIANIIRTQNVSVVHARSRAPAWSALIAARMTGAAFVTTYHGIYNAKGPLKRWYNSVMARGDSVIANSEWTARHILATYRFQPKNLKIIPRGLDLDYFDPARVSAERVATLRDWWLAKNGQRVILLPGRLTRWKGQLVFVRALGRMKREGRLPPDVRGVIAGALQGRSSYVSEIIGTIEESGLKDVVVVSDHITDMAAAYLAADIVVSASTDPEAFGRVPPEAAAMGRPVIATDHGGARETVRAGATGLLVAPGSATALAEGLGDLLARSPADLAAMGAKGRALIETNFTVERMCADTLDVYRPLIERSRKRHGRS